MMPWEKAAWRRYHANVDSDVVRGYLMQALDEIERVRGIVHAQSASWRASIGDSALRDLISEVREMGENELTRDVPRYDELARMVDRLWSIEPGHERESASPAGES